MFKRNSIQTKTFVILLGIIFSMLCFSIVPETKVTVFSKNSTLDQNTPNTELIGDGTENNPYQISTEDHLKNYIDYTFNSTDYCILTTSINVSKRFTGIGVLSGIFDGRGHSINFMDPDSKLVNRLSNGIIKNLKINANIDIENYSENNYGVFASLAEKNSIIENCTLTGSIKIKTTVNLNLGGFVGSAENTTIKNCTNKSKTDFTDNNTSKSSDDIYGTDSNIGGICGSFVGSGIFTNNNNSGQIKCIGNSFGNYDYKGKIGGLVGFSSTEITHSSNAGYIISESYNAKSAGGIVGHAENNITCCSNKGSIKTGISIGGIVGELKSKSTQNLKISNCYNTGSLESSLQGYDFRSDASIGAIIGRNENAGTVKLNSCYSTGSILPSSSYFHKKNINENGQYYDVYDDFAEQKVTRFENLLKSEEYYLSLGIRSPLNAIGMVGQSSASGSLNAENCYYSTAESAICYFDHYKIIKGIDLGDLGTTVHAPGLATEIIINHEGLEPLPEYVYDSRISAIPVQEILKERNKRKVIDNIQIVRNGTNVSLKFDMKDYWYYNDLINGEQWGQEVEGTTETVENFCQVNFQFESEGTYKTEEEIKALVWDSDIWTVDANKNDGLPELKRDDWNSSLTASIIYDLTGLSIAWKQISGVTYNPPSTYLVGEKLVLPTDNSVVVSGKKLKGWKLHKEDTNYILSIPTNSFYGDVTLYPALVDAWELTVIKKSFTTTTEIIKIEKTNTNARLGIYIPQTTIYSDEGKTKVIPGYTIINKNMVVYI